MERASTPVAYLFWIVFGAHYLYFRRPLAQLIFWLTGFGFGVWWLIDMFRIPGMVDEVNRAGGFSQSGTKKGDGGAGVLAFLGVLAVLLFVLWFNKEAIVSAIRPPPPPAPAESVPIQLPTGPEATSAQQRALQRYPELGRAGSPHNKAFVDLVQSCRLHDRAAFDDPEWPTHIAERALKKNP